MIADDSAPKFMEEFAVKPYKENDGGRDLNGNEFDLD
jgi:hypothetical protein